MNAVDTYGRWNVYTERRGEAARTGLGIDDLRQTLKHLRDRGDKRATIIDGDGSRQVELTLPLPIPGMPS